MHIFATLLLTHALITKPANIDPKLDFASTSLGNRILSYHQCSPEHCWSEIYLQRLSEDQKSVLCTAKISGLPTGSLLSNVIWEEYAERPIGKLELINTYDNSQTSQYKLYITDRLGSCHYELKKVDG